MACKRSAVRSRLAPPAFAGFASFGSASHTKLYRSEASEGCPAIARRATAGFELNPDYSPTTAFSRSRSATISSFIATNSDTEQSVAARIDCGTLRAFSFSAWPCGVSAIST